MNEQLQTALAEILSRTTQGIDAGTQFLSAQLPDVIQQLLVWKMSSSLILALVFAAVLVVAVKVAIRIFRYGKSKQARSEEKARERGSYIIDYDWFGAGMGIAGCTAVAALTLLAAVGKSLTALQIMLAPKVYLIEYAASLAK